MPLVDHLEELRQRVFRSLLAVVVAALACLVVVKPLVRLLEAPASSIHFLQLAPGEFLFVSFKVAGYAGLTLALPYCIAGVLLCEKNMVTNESREGECLAVAPTIDASCCPRPR